MESTGESPEESRRNSDEDILQTSNNVEDRLRSAQEQLAELHLLARADLHSSPTSSPSSSLEITAPSLVDDGATEPQLNENRPRTGTGGLSSFTAILAASRKMATSSLDNVGQSDAPLEQTREPLTVQIPGRCPPSPKSPGKSLPTLNEGAEGEEDEDEDDEEEATEPASTLIPASSPDDVSSSSPDAVPVKHEQEPEEVDTDDSEFEEMLEHLSQGKIEFLTLTSGDLALRKLKRVHTALSQAQSSAPTMSSVRTLVSIDMLRLLLRRLGVRAVQDAIAQAIQIQKVNEREELSVDVSPTALLTSSNLAAVLLAARHILESQASAELGPQLPRRTTAPAGRQPLHSSPKSRSSSSPCSSISSSPRSSTPRSPAAAASRRSILAKDGVHVLMQEKLVSFDHRGQANALPAFRVRGASAATTDSAAKRRQRSLQYANEHVTQRTVNL